MVAGAGISQSAGIATFRGRGSLDSKTRKLFTYAGATADPQKFYEVMNSMRNTSQTARPTLFHHMVRELKTKGCLGLLMSQNVDGLHTKVFGQLEEKTVLLHGTLHIATCTLKGHQLTSPEHQLGHNCPECVKENTVRQEQGCRRCTWDQVGTLLPAMSLYDFPQNLALGIDGLDVAKTINEEAEKLKDKSATLIIAGTSLSIPDLKRWVMKTANAVRCHGGAVVWVGLGPCNLRCVDYQLSISCDEFALAVLERMKAATSRIEEAA